MAKQSARITQFIPTTYSQGLSVKNCRISKLQNQSYITHLVAWAMLRIRDTDYGRMMTRSKPYRKPRTTDAQRGKSLHCPAENSIPIPNCMVWRQHILSATSAQFFRYLWFMPSLGVRSPWIKELWKFRISFFRNWWLDPVSKTVIMLPSNSSLSVITS